MDEWVDQKFSSLNATLSQLKTSDFGIKKLPCENDLSIY